MRLNFKRTHSYNVAAKDLYVIRIFTLDSTCVEYTISSTTNGRDALEYVGQKLDIEDICFFGLKFESWSGENKWLFLNKSIKKQLDKHARQHSLTLNVMFFVDNPQFVSDPRVRDISSGDLQVSSKLGIKLSAYSLQADFGDFVDVKTTLANWRERYPDNSQAKDELSGPFDLTTTEHHEDILWGYLHLQGVSQENAIWYFLDEIRHIPRYGVQAFKCMTCRSEPAELGISRNGIDVLTFASKQKANNNLKWEHIKDLTYTRKIFTIQLVKKNKVVSFTFPTNDDARNLWQFCIHMHSNYIDYWTKVKSSPPQPILNICEPPDILRGTESKYSSITRSPFLTGEKVVKSSTAKPVKRSGNESATSDAAPFNHGHLKANLSSPRSLAPRRGLKESRRVLVHSTSASAGPLVSSGCEQQRSTALLHSSSTDLIDSQQQRFRAQPCDDPVKRHVLDSPRSYASIGRRHHVSPPSSSTRPSDKPASGSDHLETIPQLIITTPGQSVHITNGNDNELIVFQPAPSTTPPSDQPNPDLLTTFEKHPRSTSSTSSSESELDDGLHSSLSSNSSTTCSPEDVKKRRRRERMKSRVAYRQDFVSHRHKTEDDDSSSSSESSSALLDDFDAEAEQVAPSDGTDNAADSVIKKTHFGLRAAALCTRGGIDDEGDSKDAQSNSRRLISPSNKSGSKNGLAAAGRKLWHDFIQAASGGSVTGNVGNTERPNSATLSTSVTRNNNNGDSNTDRITTASKLTLPKFGQRHYRPQVQLMKRQKQGDVATSINNAPITSLIRANLESSPVSDRQSLQRHHSPPVTVASVEEKDKRRRCKGPLDFQRWIGGQTSPVRSTMVTAASNTTRHSAGTEGSHEPETFLRPNGPLRITRSSSETSTNNVLCQTNNRTTSDTSPDWLQQVPPTVHTNQFSNNRTGRLASISPSVRRRQQNPTTLKGRTTVTAVNTTRQISSQTGGDEWKLEVAPEFNNRPIAHHVCLDVIKSGASKIPTGQSVTVPELEKNTASQDITIITGQLQSTTEVKPLYSAKTSAAIESAHPSDASTRRQDAQPLSNYALSTPPEVGNPCLQPKYHQPTSKAAGLTRDETPSPQPLTADNPDLVVGSNYIGDRIESRLPPPGGSHPHAAGRCMTLTRYIDNEFHRSIANPDAKNSQKAIESVDGHVHDEDYWSLALNAGGKGNQSPRQLQLIANLTTSSSSSSEEQSSARQTSGAIHLLTNSDIHQLLTLTNIKETELAHRLLAEYRQALLAQYSLHANSVSTPNLSLSQQQPDVGGLATVLMQSSLVSNGTATMADDLEEVEVDNDALLQDANGHEAYYSQSPGDQVEPERDQEEFECRKSGDGRHKKSSSNKRRQPVSSSGNDQLPDYVNADAFKLDSHQSDRPISMTSSTEADSNATFRILSNNAATECRRRRRRNASSNDYSSLATLSAGGGCESTTKSFGQAKEDKPRCVVRGEVGGAPPQQSCQGRERRQARPVKRSDQDSVITDNASSSSRRAVTGNNTTPGEYENLDLMPDEALNSLCINSPPLVSRSDSTTSTLAQASLTNSSPDSTATISSGHYESNSPGNFGQHSHHHDNRDHRSDQDGDRRHRLNRNKCFSYSQGPAASAGSHTTVKSHNRLPNTTQSQSSRSSPSSNSSSSSRSSSPCYYSSEQDLLLARRNTTQSTDPNTLVLVKLEREHRGRPGKVRLRQTTDRCQACCRHASSRRYILDDADPSHSDGEQQSYRTVGDGSHSPSGSSIASNSSSLSYSTSSLDLRSRHTTSRVKQACRRERQCRIQQSSANDRAIIEPLCRASLPPSRSQDHRVSNTHGRDHRHHRRMRECHMSVDDPTQHRHASSYNRGNAVDQRVNHRRRDAGHSIDCVDQKQQQRRQRRHHFQKEQEHKARDVDCRESPSVNCVPHAPNEQTQWILVPNRRNVAGPDCCSQHSELIQHFLSSSLAQKTCQEFRHDSPPHNPSSDENDKHELFTLSSSSLVKCPDVIYSSNLGQTCQENVVPEVCLPSDVNTSTGRGSSNNGSILQSSEARQHGLNAPSSSYLPMLIIAQNNRESFDPASRTGFALSNTYGQDRNFSTSPSNDRQVSPNSLPFCLAQRSSLTPTHCRPPGDQQSHPANCYNHQPHATPSSFDTNFDRHLVERSHTPKILYSASVVVNPGQYRMGSRATTNDKNSRQASPRQTSSLQLPRLESSTVDQSVRVTKNQFVRPPATSNTLSDSTRRSLTDCPFTSYSQSHVGRRQSPGMSFSPTTTFSQIPTTQSNSSNCNRLLLNPEYNRLVCFSNNHE